jgi:ribonuclease G
MAKEICISSTPHETRLAILEDDQLAEIYYERENEYTLAGSIYNGKVTRVLPGMQSAFVDLGLERDAFLYVTDFIELEDQEEADELEKAAAGGQPPREVHHSEVHHGEVRHGHDRNGGRQGQRGEQRHEPQVSSHRPPEEAVARTLPEPGEESGRGEATRDRGEAGQDSGEPGGRRWKGRRRRRGGRGTETPQTAAGETGPAREESTETYEEPEMAPEIHAVRETQAPRVQQTPAFVLPGESLSRYGGAAAESAEPAPKRAAVARPASTFKPSTMIEAPLSWDGSGLLPGESLSRHRERKPEPVQTPGESSVSEVPIPEPQESFAAEPESGTKSAIEREDIFEQMEEMAPPALREIDSSSAGETAGPFDHPAEGLRATDPEVGGSESGTRFESFDSEPPASESAAEGGDDASASHRVDPSGPSGFRLFGFGSKKKDGPTEEEAPVAGAQPPVPTYGVGSGYAPGTGVVEEEVIEGAEFDSVPRRHDHDPHGLEMFEEETLPTNMRTGDLGEMLQEAHLDHRIDLNFEEKGLEEEEFDSAEEEEEPAAEAQPQPGREPRKRGGREQRGRGAPPGRRGPARRSAQTSDLPIISDLLKPGQEILVQIAKEPIAKKGARITSHIALPGRFLVFMPTVSHVGVSRKIASEEERHRLKRILVNERGEASGGFIVRTAAEGASEDELRADLRFLMNLWADIKQRSESLKSPALIYRDLSLIERILRDQVSDNFSSIWVDTQEDYERIVKFLNRFSPTLVRRVKLYTKETPLFEHFGIQDEIAKAMRSKVWLKSGGSIVINQTEALVAIDINTGKYVGKSARLEDTILKTNLDAVPEIVRQIRLRDLGGIIVIDFIDMDERKNRYKVMAALEEALKNDRAPTKVLQFNDFGLVAITRKRVKQSLERTLSVPCPTCQATGMVKSATTVCNEIYIEMRKMRKHFESSDVMLRVNPETVKILKSNGNRWLNEFEELVGKNVLVKSDPALHPEQFDIQG